MSRRKELDEYMNTGRLRDAVTGELSDEALELLLDIVARYCAPRRSSAWRRAVKESARKALRAREAGGRS